jgi:histidinol-phosphate aminotransferase
LILIVCGFTQAIGSYFNLDVNHIFLGNGSDEILAFCFQAFFNPCCSPCASDQIIFPDISYSFYPVYAQLYDIPFRTVDLLTDMSVPVDALKKPSAGIILANPNAPTGRALDLAAIADIADSDPNRLLIIDEAYVDFGAESAVALLSEHDNILVVQTFSKSRSLAGLRLGYALGAPELIRGLERIRDSFNSYTIDLLAQMAGEAAIADGAYFEETRSRIIATRTWTVAVLAGLGFDVVPSAANFIFVRHPQVQGRSLQQALRQHGILVRHFERPKTTDYLRISIGTDTEMQALVDALTIILADTTPIDKN